MRRTNLLLASLTLFLLLALGCQQKPESIVSSNEAEKSLSKANAERWFLTFKGRVEFSDGTVYESRVERTVALPQRLRGSAWTEQTESLDQNYYIQFVPAGLTFNLLAGSYAIFYSYDLKVHSCDADWATRAILTVSANTTTVGGEGDTKFNDSKTGLVLGYNVPIPPGQTGVFVAPFHPDVHAAFDNDGDVDRNDARVDNYDSTGGGYIRFTSIKYHLRSRNIACQ